VNAQERASLVARIADLTAVYVGGAYTVAELRRAASDYLDTLAQVPLATERMGEAADGRVASR
jgi:hypothetical protein